MTTSGSTSSSYRLDVALAQVSTPRLIEAIESLFYQNSTNPQIGFREVSISVSDCEFLLTITLFLSTNDLRIIAVGANSSIDYVATILVVNPNDYAPVFDSQSYSFILTEDQPPQTTVGSVRATDADDPTTPQGQIEYSLRSFEAEFSIHNETGE